MSNPGIDYSKLSKWINRYNYVDLSIYLLSFLSLLLFFTRIFLNINFTYPLQILTSGCEEEALFSIWKFIHNQEVYQDFHTIPFTASYFNWLFYYTYGSISGLILELFNLPIEYLPQVTRMITLPGVIANSIVLYKIVSHFSDRKNAFTYILAFTISVSPLVGFWAITTRPDVWAYFFELLAFYLFISIENTKWYKYISIGFVCYLAWSFKQNQICSILTISILCLTDRKYSYLLPLFGIFSALIMITFLYENDVYFLLTVKSNAQMGTALSLGLRNIAGAFMKATPYLIIPVFYLFSSYKKHNFLFPLAIFFIVSFIIMGLFSSKIGASDYYLILPSLCGGCIVMVLWQNDLIKNLTQKILVSISFFILSFNILIVLTGFRGKLSNAETNLVYQEIGASVKELAQPVLVTDGYGSLPWINPAESNFVLATTYYFKDSYKEKFEANGIEGLIDQKYFNYIITLKNQSKIIDSTKYDLLNENKMFLKIYKKKTD